ncbi:MAG: ferric reductase-like transmembrane domain-containing protein [Candidatus Nanopelagicales bacterium]|jgi:DMSO/TMAO reductase YedYZ heme-binding membrane subunit|nr:ferric reductase-like transmembrane domain-containing protein [Candidatus Nanopelagicales bacterium]
MDLPWMWFVLRASGLVAVGLLTVSVVLGIVGPRLRPTTRLATITAHRAAAVAGTVLIVVHVVLAVLDPWITMDWPAALLPGVSGWQRWGVALGALAVDLLLALLVTTAMRRRAPRAWRRVHLVAVPLWALAVGHGLLVGSDPAAMRWMAVTSAGLVLAATAVRLLVPPRAPVARAVAPAGPPVVAGRGAVR